jgi:S-adenosylmethionine:tRNA-ribosyltransferase-isomerase (queuine synthetase)
VCEVRTDLFSRVARQKWAKKSVLAIGTTTTRTLESLPYLRAQLSSEQKIAHRDEATRHYRDALTECITEEESKIYVTNIIFHSSFLVFNCTLYIYPGCVFRVIDQLITNFHLPKSSLLMLVAWYIWYEQMKQIYNHAIQQQYRFFSFWDGMLVV